MSGTIRKETDSIIRYVVLLILMLGMLDPVSGQDNPDLLPTFFDTIYPMDIDRMEILVDIDSLLANKMTEKEHDATIRIIKVDSETLEFPLKVSVRSKSRRRYCSFPPLKFDFDKDLLESMGLRRQDDYKIVTHCLEVSTGQPLLEKEYLVYQLYEIITPMCLRSKMFDVIYRDIGSKEEIKTKAVILESAEEFAARMGGELCDCMGTPADSIDPFLFEQLSLFQYMVGNHDLNVSVERNVKLVKLAGDAKMIPFAYDFDFAAVVNAPYAYPEYDDNRKLMRYYQGFEENRDQMEKVGKVFLDKEQMILDHIENSDFLSKFEIRAIRNYIKDFYRTLSKGVDDLPYKQFK
jgi:hypothetical protein